VELSPQDVRDVRFGTTRMRAGYDMAEVDAFLDTIEKAIESYSSDSRHVRDEADALRSQVHQLQTRLASVQAELDECRALDSPAPSDGHDTVITQVEASVDHQTTAENPVLGPDLQTQVQALRRVRDDVRAMLADQLTVVDGLDIP
jgi:DivIVA domain-containing protein